MSIRAGLIYKDLNKKNLQYKTSIQHYAQALYPSTPPTINRFRKQVELEFSTLAKKQHYPLIETLKTIAQVRKNLGLTVTGINYEFSDLVLSVKSENPEQIDKMISILGQYQIRSEQIGYELKGQTVLAKLKIKIK